MRPRIDSSSHRNPFRPLAGILGLQLLLLPFATGEALVEREVFEIRAAGDFDWVEEALNRSAAESVEVRIAAGHYTLFDTFLINRSEVVVRGEGEVTLSLADRVEKPVLAIGSQSQHPVESERIWNVTISDLSIDGNRDNQPSEYDRDLPWIRNNGIDARRVTGLRVERVTSNNNRSGGLVISWGCRNVFVRDSIFDLNYFDGVAYYDSERVVTIDCVMRNNNGAGVSLDNAFVDSMFARCLIEWNRDVGVFVRHAKRLVFLDCDIVGSGNWALFFSHDESQQGVFNIDVSHCRIAQNDGGLRMGSVTEAQSRDNWVSFSTFLDNGASGRANVSTAGSVVRVRE